MVEKAFENLKDRLNLRRVAVSSEQSLDGKMFVQFLSLIFLSYITKKMKGNYGGPQCQDSFPFNLSVIFTFPPVFVRLCNGSVFRPASASSGSGSQVPRMGTSKSARRRELASAGAGFWNTVLFILPT
jgi:hypothetical protein